MALATYKWSVSVIDSLTYTLFIEQLGNLSWTNELKSAKHIYVKKLVILSHELKNLKTKHLVLNNSPKYLYF